MFIKLLCLIVFVITGHTAQKLVQVVVLGRHNLRTPLFPSLQSLTPKVWPKWTEPPGFLTAKGGLLEAYMGEYFSEWLKNASLLNDECPSEDSVFFYVNAPQRTRETAKRFTEAAFRDCNVTVHFKKNTTTDPVFHPVVLNRTDTFKRKATQEMQMILNKLKLHDAYSKLNTIVDFSNSKICKETLFCDLTKKKDKIVIQTGLEPDIAGPLNTGNFIMDELLMEFYNGTMQENIGWGGVKEDDWNLLTSITRENQNVRFSGTFLATHIAAPILHKINEIISNRNIKFAMLVGHDSNINSVIAALRIKPFNLPDQFERSPVGGKLVFQKYLDDTQNRYLLKINYVYQTTDQLRNATPLSLSKPPNSVPLELFLCNTDENGFCDWEDFVKIMKKFK